ncbi:MAG TPA: glycosyl transferase family 1 [Pricia antarctica]|uniref:Glycosyl transferase family 1 n=2 Tax=root TaxID=1 RepID=A0A831VQ80_9FLAO|nr:glycosyl transferase family 1 [Pricia antarctica]
MKKVLIITYYWPPAGGPGVQRWLKFVKYLRDFQVEPVVYIPENPHYPIEDASLEKDIPKDLIIYKQPLFEPYGLAKVFSRKKTKRISSGIIQSKNQSALEKAMLWVRGNFFIPDARKYWVKPSVKFLLEVLEKEGIDTVITTGPPHSVHLIGQHLKIEKDIRWLADFRDPWTSIGYHKKLRLTASSLKKHKVLEHSVLNGADHIIVTSPATAREFKDITSQPITIITNGHDSDYGGDAHLDKDFTISHIGSLLTGRNPINLWKVLSQIASENSVFRADLQLEFMGLVSKDVMDSLYRFELGPYIKLRGYGSHAEAQRRQQRSQILLLVEIDSEETKGIIPGKLFEYMAAERPILALGPKNWEAGKIIEETQSGSLFDYDTHDELKKTILKWYKAFKKDSLSSKAKDIEKYSRKSLTEQLAKLM